MTSLRIANAPSESPLRNHLLAALPAEDFARVADQLELVQLRVGDMLYEPGSHLKYAYFPTSAIISIHYVMATGASAETASVGNDGVLGISIFLGGQTTSSSAMVNTGGYAYRLPRTLLMQEFDLAGPLQRLLLRYTQALVTQTLLTAACNRHHSVEQQLCRWLLTALDRLPSNELVMTQELVSRMLGVRREGVTEAAGKLQHAGYISYRRGHISVLNRVGLERHACECYGEVKKEMSRLFKEELRR